MTKEEAGRWLFLAGCAMGEAERYWFGSLYDLGRDMRHVLRKGGPSALRALAKTFAGRKSGPGMRAMCLFARSVARAVEASETGSPPPYGAA